MNSKKRKTSKRKTVKVKSRGESKKSTRPAASSRRMIWARLHSKSRYLELVSDFPLVVIQDDAELEDAISVLDKFLAKDELTSAEEGYVDTLSNLIADYEDKHHAIEPPTDAGMLQHLMDAKGVTASELAEGTKISKSAISMVLSGSRNFSPKQIAVFSRFFGVSKAVLSANIGDPIEA